ncbi:MAG TPA: type IV pilus secretin PilQ, partial [Thermoanaerobaculia bacterium]|nr:type IV pilus secretin PilQ [Thermoanaerobaculia bacterium]
GVVLVGVGTADAGIWGRKAEKKPPAAEVSIAAPVSLSAVEVDGSRVTLRTNGAPAYTSYSPAPGVFVVDLTGTTRESTVAIPETLPPAVTSIAADEVVEMGSKLTRVTFRLSEPLLPEVAAIEKAVVVTIPATAIPIQTADAAPAVEVLPVVTPAATEAVIDETPAIEETMTGTTGTTAEAAVATPAVATPAVATPVVEDVPLPRARAVKRIGATTKDGNVEVRITGDGQLEYKAFRLESPSRLVIDLQGVKNTAKQNSISVDDDVVQRVRVAQFQPNVARVVVDLSQKSEYDIATVGDEIRIAFGANAQASKQVAPAYVPPAPAPAPEPEPVKVAEKPKVLESLKPAPADIPSQVPTIAETKPPSWKVPEPASQGARSRISPAVDQAPPPTQQQQEDVFSDATVQQQPQSAVTTAQSLTGSRTLSTTQRVFNGEPISLNLKDADIKDVLRTFAELTGLNIAVDPGVTGAVTVDFVDVPWDQALDLILRQNGLTFVLEGNVMRIGTIERIAAEAAATRRLEEEERLKVTLTTLSFKLSYARAQEVQALLRDIASPRARIIVDQRTNQLIVSEIPEVLRTMQNLILTVDIPSRQVMIEARIVESLRTFTQQYGIAWGFEGALDPALGTGTGLVFPNRVGFVGGPFDFAVGDPVINLTLFDVLGTFDLDLTLHAAETRGYAKVVSAPRVTTQDNQAAEIQSGFQIPYQTRVNFTTTVTYLDATLRLTVTPQITEAGTVIMDISVQKNEPATGLTIAGAAGTPLTTRQARTRLMVRDGGTAVIAGIFQTRDGDARSGVPILNQIPIIGALFRSRDITTSHDELLIFITPRIVRG